MTRNTSKGELLRLHSNQVLLVHEADIAADGTGYRFGNGKFARLLLQCLKAGGQCVVMTLIHWARLIDDLGTSRRPRLARVTSTACTGMRHAATSGN